MSATVPRHRAGALWLAVCLLPLPAAARDAVKVVPLASIEPRGGEGTGPLDVKPVDAKPADAKPNEMRASGFEARTPHGNAIRTELTVVVDRAKVIRLPDRAQTIVIGNPAVADIAVQKNGVVVLTGKSYGVTNFIAMDSGGNPIAESKVSVTAPSDGTLLVQRGLERQTYSCTPNCLPTVQLGDSTAFFGEARGQVDAHTSFATPR